ncbi:hypothetical protein Y88_0641 [Novosphingobium nitrogenifigens DSM 19370]|uniref:Flp/Fap pilin component n=1 Tax=Novosphingobium nitrogenifigens DSM 19370 TaxID=983920 RepID=F1ZA08_9SPHN|nr:Flp family type IVb pilin [Novosphingobium nitrogenifigens]EGD58584.1 hypothetical protein Y88_0641 [Novosphingobium nitrogenifigens DSM 19370]
MTMLRHILRDTQGATAVEYGILVGIFSIGIIFGFTEFTNQLYNLWLIVGENTDAAVAAHNN